jgi:hypothetical protein
MVILYFIAHKQNERYIKRSFSLKNLVGPVPNQPLDEWKRFTRFILYCMWGLGDYQCQSGRSGKLYSF